MCQRDNNPTIEQTIAEGHQWVFNDLFVSIGCCRHYDPLICPRSIIMPSDAVVSLYIVSGHCIHLQTIISDIRHFTGSSVWKHLLMDTISLNNVLILDEKLVMIMTGMHFIVPLRKAKTFHKRKTIHHIFRRILKNTDKACGFYNFWRREGCLYYTLKMIFLNDGKFQNSIFNTAIWNRKFLVSCEVLTGMFPVNYWLDFFLWITDWIFS